jgi:HNH endonuclease
MRLDFCALCGEADAAALEHHHFIPRALGGSDDESNMLTVCGTCHGRIHDIPRPIRLGELVKAGITKAQERTAADYREIADASARRAEKATELAKEAEKAERRIGDSSRRALSAITIAGKSTAGRNHF